METNFSISSALTGPVSHAISPRGVQGYLPAHPELQASFFLIAPDVRKGHDLGAIDMRNIAPTVAMLLDIPFPTAELKPLEVLK